MSRPLPGAALRMADIEPFHVMQLLARAQELEASGRDVVHMEIGEPDFPSPPPVIEAGREALSAGFTHYTPATGIPPLREALAEHYARRFGVTLDPQRIAVTPGGSGALLLALAATVNPGDEVLLPDPGYPCNRHFVRLVEGRPVSVAVDAASNYQLSLELLARHWGPRTRAVMLASPSNPTGTTLSREQLRAIIGFVEERGGIVLLDEIYQGLVYDAEPFSALSFSDAPLVINSFSKYFHMTGWRLGWLVTPPQLVGPVERLAQNVFLSASAPAQRAALAALAPQTEPLLEECRRQFAARRGFLLPALREAGFAIPVTPAGAFYIYADCSALSGDSFGFARELLEREAVAIAPGIDFGSNRPERHVRFAYTTSIDKLAEGVARIRRFVAAT